MSKKYIICIIIILLITGLGILGYFLWEKYACIDVSPDCACLVGYSCNCPSHREECSFQIFKENLFSTNK